MTRGGSPLPGAVEAGDRPGDRASDNTDPAAGAGAINEPGELNEPGALADRVLRDGADDRTDPSRRSAAVAGGHGEPPARRVEPRGVGADPTALVLDLDQRRTSDSAAVRRDVSRALATLSVQRPTLAVATAQRWLAEGGPHTTSVVQRGLRPLVLARDDTALRLAGYSPAAAVRVVDLEIDVSPVPAFGGGLRFSARVVSATLQPAPALVEYRIEHRAAAGELRHATGRLLARTVDPLADVGVRRTHRLPRQPSSRWIVGPCRLIVTINGRDDATATFTL